MKNTTKLNDIELNALKDVICFNAPLVIAGVVNKDDKVAIRTLAPNLLPLLVPHVSFFMSQDIPISNDKKVFIFYGNLPKHIDGELKELYDEVVHMCREEMKKLKENKEDENRRIRL